MLEKLSTIELRGKDNINPVEEPRPHIDTAEVIAGIVQIQQIIAEHIKKIDQDCKSIPLAVWHAQIAKIIKKVIKRQT